jgi:hypothetical protein
MSLLDELDESMETVGEIANHLEAQMGRYERPPPPALHVAQQSP